MLLVAFRTSICGLRCSIWVDIPSHQRSWRRYVSNSVSELISYLGAFLDFQIFAKLPCDKPSRRQCPPDLVKCLGCAFFRAGLNLGCNLFCEISALLGLICSVNQFEVLEPSTGQTFQSKGPLFWSNLCDISERLDRQHVAAFNNVWCIQKAKKRWQTHPSFFHICEEGLFLVFRLKFLVWFEGSIWFYQSLCLINGHPMRPFLSAKVCPSICWRGWAMLYLVGMIPLLTMSSS